MPIRPEMSAPARTGPPAPTGLPLPAPPSGDPWRERLRRWFMAAIVGAAVIVTPGGPSPGRGPGWRPPAYERALRWRDIIRLRLSPWLLSGMFTPSAHAAPADAPSPPSIPPEPRRDPPGESLLP